jgi:hypothetical protein
MHADPKLLPDPKLCQLLDYLNGRESDEGDVGAVAKHVASHLQDRRPPKGSAEAANFTYPHWRTIEEFKTYRRFKGPAVSLAQIDAAIAAAGL